VRLVQVQFLDSPCCTVREHHRLADWEDLLEQVGMLDWTGTMMA